MPSPRRSILRLLAGVSLAGGLIVVGLNSVPTAAVESNAYCDAMVDPIISA